MKPKIVCITTPNKDYNVLFDMEPEEMRHWDHKFEWTQQEFQSWCRGIVEQHPRYVVTFGGVGAPPADVSMINHGFASQIATFYRKDFLQVESTFGLK